jgi:beta-RFAP synthase
MKRPTIRVSAPSRLHFGMIWLNRAGARHYGGAGVMVRRPGLLLEVDPAEEFETVGPLGDRVRRFVRRASDHFCAGARADTDANGCRNGVSSEDAGANDAWPRCRISVLRAPRPHVGLGSGTQLGLAVAAGLCAYQGRDIPSADQLARAVGRGQRSAIGVHGFQRGGLLFEGGKTEPKAISPLVARVETPEAWRFVLVCDRTRQGLSGTAERSAFDKLPAVPLEESEALYREAVEHLMPAAADGRFEDFAESMYRFGYRAGLMFAAQQGGAFAGPELTSLVERIRAKGVRGVGQSSWGPTVYALLPNPQEAERLVSELRAEDPEQRLDFTVTGVDNEGATIETHTAHKLGGRTCSARFLAQPD